MKPSVLLTITSLRSIPIGTFHLAADCGVHNGANPGSPTTQRMEEAKWT